MNNQKQMGLKLNVANKITVGRILVVPLFISLILYYSPQKDYLRLLALAVFVIAVISDVIDGYIARVKHQRTPAGAILDPLADKMLLISAFICLYKVGVHFPIRFPIWLVVTVISRDVILLVGTLLIYVFHGHLPIEASLLGKISTFFQVLIIAGMFLQLSLSVPFWYFAVVFAVLSGLDYIRQGVKLINTSAEGV